MGNRSAPTAALLCLLLLARGVAAEDAMAPYQPKQQVSGVIRSWGHGFLKVMMKYWEKDFQRFQPNVTFQDDLLSSAAAMAGLYSGRADLGILLREITPPEVAAYEKVAKQKEFPVQILTGSYGNPDKIMALGIFVNKANPLAKLTFAQLDAIFGAEHKGGAPRNIRSWGQAGLAGDWKQRPIHPYSGPAFEAPAFYFSHTVMKGSVLWNCDLKQLDDLPVSGGKPLDGYQRVVDAVGKDPDGIALTGAGYRNPDVKLIALAVGEDGPFVAPTPETVQSRAYPLSRPASIYINNGPALPPDPKVVEFLRYVLSRDGQAQVLKEGDFLPLTAAEAARQTARLDASLQK